MTELQIQACAKEVLAKHNLHSEQWIEEAAAILRKHNTPAPDAGSFAAMRKSLECAIAIIENESHPGPSYKAERLMRWAKELEAEGLSHEAGRALLDDLERTKAALGRHAEILTKWAGFVKACLPYTPPPGESLQGRTLAALADADGRAALEELTDLRDAIKLIVGRETGVPWREVPDREVDGYLDGIRRLKAAGEGR